MGLGLQGLGTVASWHAGLKRCVPLQHFIPCIQEACCAPQHTAWNSLSLFVLNNDLYSFILRTRPDFVCALVRAIGVLYFRHLVLSCCATFANARAVWLRAAQLKFVAKCRLALSVCPHSSACLLALWAAGGAAQK